MTPTPYEVNGHTHKLDIEQGKVQLDKFTENLLYMQTFFYDCSLIMDFDQSLYCQYDRYLIQNRYAHKTCVLKKIKSQ